MIRAAVRARALLSLAAIGSVAGALAFPGSAAAETDDLPVADQSESPAVVVAPPATVAEEASQDAAVFYATGPIGDNTLVVMPEIYEAVGLTFEDVRGLDTVAEISAAIAASAGEALLSSCGGVVTGVYGSWSSASTSQCSVAGSPNYRLPYAWNVQPNTNQSAAVQGRGYYVGYNGSEMGVWSQWYGVGVGASGYATVPWGNVWSYPKARARSMIPVHIAQVYWSH